MFINKKNSPHMILMAASLSLALSACEPPASTVSSSGTGTSSDPACFVEKPSIPNYDVSGKIDILIMRGAASNSAANDDILAMVSAFPQDADIRIGVMAAFGDRDEFAGKLLKVAGDRDKWVLDLRKDSRELVHNRLEAKLTEALKVSHGCRHSDLRESGIFSMNRAMDHGMLQSIRAKGLMRKDAALLVLFVSDAADVCGRGADSASFCRRHAPAQFDLSNNRDDDRDDDDGDNDDRDDNRHSRQISSSKLETVTAALVYKKLKAMQGCRPFMVSGTNKADVRQELIQLSGGFSFDPSLVDAAEVLNSSTMRFVSGDSYSTNFTLSQSDINVATIEVLVNGGNADFVYHQETNEVSLSGSLLSSSTLEIRYCQNAAPCPQPVPSPEASAEPEPEPTPEASPSPEPTPEPTPAPEPTPVPAPEPTPSPSPSPCSNPIGCGGLIV